MAVDNRAMGVCPHCEDELVFTEIGDEGLVQEVTQHCPSCDVDVPLALCHYPGGQYIGIAEALEGDVCRRDGCDYDAVLRAQEAGMGTTSWYCARCAPLHYLSTGREAGLELR